MCHWPSRWCHNLRRYTMRWFVLSTLVSGLAGLGLVLAAASVVVARSSNITQRSHWWWWVRRLEALKPEPMRAAHE